MDIQVVGINHKTTPIEIREKFFFSVTQQELFLSELKSQPSVVEAMILSTCNRTEVYYCALSSRNNPEEIIRTLFSSKNIKDSRQLKNSFYHYVGEDAVRHLFHVTAGMDSLVLGERQILGQVKDAVTLARKKAMLGKYLNILTNLAIRTAKKTHNETHISFGGVSISWAAVVMAERVLKTLKGKSVLILGAGKMSHLATEQIYKKGAAKIFIMNRTESCAMTLAELYKGEAVSFCDIKEALSQVDLCICSVGAPHYILERPTVEKVIQQRDNRPLVFIDISMPRNIDPQVALVPGVLLFHVDDLDNVVSESMKKRQTAAVGAEKIIAEKVLQFYQKIGRLNKNISSDYFQANLNSSVFARDPGL